MKNILPILAGVALLPIAATATSSSNIVGYTIGPCPPDSDTIVGTPLREAAEFAGALVADAGVDTLQFDTASDPWTVDEFANTHYVKLSSGNDNGMWFPITANTADTLTVNLLGDMLTAVTGDKAEIIKLWTLAELFDPAAATTDAATTPNAIVASTNTLASGRRTEVKLPDTTTDGINLAPVDTFFVHGGIWKKQGGGAADFGNTPLFPENYFVVRNPPIPTISQGTEYLIVGEVEPNDFTIPLATTTTGLQDNFIALPRPINITLNDLNLKGTAAFVESTNTLASGRRDQLLVFDNAQAAQNKAPTTTYYVHAGIWKKQGGGAADVGTEEIPGGWGFIIRKYQTVDGASHYWTNPPTY